MVLNYADFLAAQGRKNIDKTEKIRIQLVKESYVHLLVVLDSV